MSKSKFYPKAIPVYRGKVFVKMRAPTPEELKEQYKEWKELNKESLMEEIKNKKASASKHFKRIVKIWIGVGIALVISLTLFSLLTNISSKKTTPVKKGTQTAVKNTFPQHAIKNYSTSSVKNPTFKIQKSTSTFLVTKDSLQNIRLYLAYKNNFTTVSLEGTATQRVETLSITNCKTCTITKGYKYNNGYIINIENVGILNVISLPGITKLISSSSTQKSPVVFNNFLLNKGIIYYIKRDTGGTTLHVYSLLSNKELYSIKLSGTLIPKNAFNNLIDVKNTQINLYSKSIVEISSPYTGGILLLNTETQKEIKWVNFKNVNSFTNFIVAGNDVYILNRNALIHANLEGTIKNRTNLLIEIPKIDTDAYSRVITTNNYVGIYQNSAKRLAIYNSTFNQLQYSAKLKDTTINPQSIYIK